MRIEGKGFSVAGPSRAVNEDMLYLDNTEQIFLVADGMGGHVGGARASELASETVSQCLRDMFDQDSQADQMQDIDRWEKYIRDAFASASYGVFQLSTEKESLRGMGTTLTSLVHRDGNGIVGHVGDSRLYLYRGDVLHQLTHDHTIVTEMLEAGDITPSQVPGHPYAHVLTRAIGVHESVCAETFVFEFAVGDRLLLCSDGFYDLFEGHDELLSFLQVHIESDFLEAIEILVDEKKASDNVTIAVLEVLSDDDEVERDTAQSKEVVLKVEVLKNVALFGGLEISEIVSLVQAGVVHQIASGAEIVQEGQAGDNALFVILEGEVEVVRGEKALTRLSSGNHFGEMSLLSDDPRSATVRALSEVSVLELSKGVIENFFSKSPRSGVEFLLAMAREFSGRLRDANRSCG